MKIIISLIGLLPIFASAQEAVDAPAKGNPLIQTLVMVLIAGFFFYFILWRPEKKRRKKMEEQRNSLKKGDRVTAMGIIGTVDKIEENTVILKMIDGAKIEILKAAITDVQSSDKAQESDKELAASKK